MAIKISDITQFTGSNYGVYKFQAKATDNTSTYADSDLSNIAIYNIPLLTISLSNKTVSITGFIESVTQVAVYIDGAVASTLNRTTEETMTYVISDTVDPQLPHKIYVVAIGTGIAENYSNTVIYGVLPTFADNDWDTIASVSEQIAQLSLTGDLLYEYVQQQYGWEVGMTKPITLKNGDTYNLQIWDFNDKVDMNNNKIGITFGTVELQRSTAQMNAINTNVGGFGASKMATTTLPSIYELLPSDLQNVIKEAKITYHSGSDDPTTELSDYYKLYLPSEYEIFHTTNYARQEGAWLKYWQLHNTSAERVKYRVGSTGASRWWLRSATSGTSVTFAVVGGGGALTNNSASSSNGVCLCLSI